MALVGTMDAPGEEIMRLKFALEAEQTVKAVASQGTAKKSAAACDQRADASEEFHNAPNQVPGSSIELTALPNAAQQLAEPAWVYSISVTVEHVS